MDEQNNLNEQATAPAPQGGSKAPAIVALICGIVGIVLAWWGWSSIIALAASIVGIVLGTKGRKNADTKGMATAGLVLGIIGVVLAGIGVACWACAACGAAALTDAAYSLY